MAGGVRCGHFRGALFMRPNLQRPCRVEVGAKRSRPIRPLIYSGGDRVRIRRCWMRADRLDEASVPVPDGLIVGANPKIKW